MGRYICVDLGESTMIAGIVRSLEADCRRSEAYFRQAVLHFAPLAGRVHVLLEEIAFCPRRGAFQNARSCGLPRAARGRRSVDSL